MYTEMVFKKEQPSGIIVFVRDNCIFIYLFLDNCIFNAELVCYKTSTYLSNGALILSISDLYEVSNVSVKICGRNLGLYKEWSVIRRLFCIWNLVIFACLII